MSQRYPDINSPQFGQQARSAIVGLVLAYLLKVYRLNDVFKRRASFF